MKTVKAKAKDLNKLADLILSKLAKLKNPHCVTRGFKPCARRWNVENAGIVFINDFDMLNPALFDKDICYSEVYNMEGDLLRVEISEWQGRQRIYHTFVIEQ